jgi:tRNA (guanine-N7-)-methyltransferase
VTDKRTIRSFVTRKGRISPAQRNALQQYLAEYALPPEHLALVSNQFPSKQPLSLEIGFGMGDSLLEMLLTDPNRNFLGLEVHEAGIGHLVNEAKKAEIKNLKVIKGDAVEVLEKSPASVFDRIQVFFPDPWHKKKHHKRRLISDVFMDLVHRALLPNGIFHVATDWQPYADQMDQLFQLDRRFQRCLIPSRPETKYERRGLSLGHKVTDIALTKIDS